MTLSTKFVYTRTIKRVEERCAKRWLSGVGPDAKFADDSQGWYALFEEDPVALYLGTTETGLRAGDRMRLTAEKVD